jgi:hypothetical protein
MANTSPEELASKEPGFRLAIGNPSKGQGDAGGGGALGAPRFGAPQSFAGNALISPGFWANMTTNNMSFALPAPPPGTGQIYFAVLSGTTFISDGTVFPDVPDSATVQLRQVTFG